MDVRPEPAAPPSRWYVPVAFAAVGAATQLLWLTFAGVTTVTASRYGVSEAAVGWLAQVFPLVYVVLAIPAGMVLDRWFRGGLAAGALLTALGAAIRLVGTDFGWVLAGQVVIAIAQPLVLNAVTGVTGRYLAPKDRPAGIALGTAATFAGMVVAFVLAAVLPAATDLPALMTIGAVFAAAAALALLVGLRRPGPQAHVAPPAGLGALRVAWADGFVRRLCAYAFLPFGVFVALTTFAQALLEPAGVDATTASLILLINVVAGVIGCAVAPVLATRRRREVALLVVGLVVSVVGIGTLAVAPGAATAWIALALIGIALLPALPIVLTLVEQRTGEVEGTAAGLVWMAGNLGGLVVATAVGALLDRPAIAFGLLAVVTAAGIPLALRLRPDIAALHSGPVARETATR